jgi:hypothetical protein
MGYQERTWPWYEGPYWEEIAARFERIAEEEGEAVARASVWFDLYGLQLLFALTPFALMAKGRPPGGADGWLATRGAIETSKRVIEASVPLTAFGFGTELERNRQIVSRVLQVSEEWAEGASEKARDATGREKKRLMTQGPEPRRTCKTKRGSRPPWGERSEQLGHKTRRGQGDFFLQHPRDNDFRRARAGIKDLALLELVDAWIDDWQRNYEELVGEIPADCRDHAELAFEAVAGSAEDELLIGLNSPAAISLRQREKGDAAESEAIATNVLLLELGRSPQPDGIALEPQERWWIYGHRLEDGTIMPCWGTHRLAAG